MSRVFSPDIQRFLQIEEVIIELSDKDIPANIALISNDFLWLIIPENITLPEKIISHFKIEKQYISVTLQKNKNVNQNGFSLIQFKYDLKRFSIITQEKIHSLFTHNKDVQRRKNIRIDLDNVNQKHITITKESLFQIDSEWNDCILKDISLTGCKIICLGKTYQIAAEKSKILIRIFFNTPEEDFIILGTVIRKNIYTLNNTIISECAIEFIQPINIFFEKRILGIID